MNKQNNAHEPKCKTEPNNSINICLVPYLVWIL